MNQQSRSLEIAHRHLFNDSSYDADSVVQDASFLHMLQTWLQVEPYLYLGMGQVSLYDEEGKIFFSRGVDLNDTIILDPWVK